MICTAGALGKAGGDRAHMGSSSAGAADPPIRIWGHFAQEIPSRAYGVTSSPGADRQGRKSPGKSGAFYPARELARSNFQYSRYSRQQVQYIKISDNFNIQGKTENSLNFQIIAAVLFAWERRGPDPEKETFCIAFQRDRPCSEYALVAV